MRRTILIVGAILLLAGLVMQYGAWLMAWLSRLLGMNTPAATYQDFVEGVMQTMMLGHGVGRILAPWALMVLGLALIVASRRVARQT